VVKVQDSVTVGPADAWTEPAAIFVFLPMMTSKLLWLPGARAGVNSSATVWLPLTPLGAKVTRVTAPGADGSCGGEVIGGGDGEGFVGHGGDAGGCGEGERAAVGVSEGVGGGFPGGIDVGAKVRMWTPMESAPR
jgi:hypothetical protein